MVGNDELQINIATKKKEWMRNNNDYAGKLNGISSKNPYMIDVK